MIKSIERQLQHMKEKLTFLLPRPLLIILLVAFTKHLLTFMAYDWFEGIDYYSFDIPGMQLVSGQIFDLFPIFFHPPLIPVVKNLLYLIFEGHPYALAIFIHFLGIATVILTYQLGNRFHRMAGFVMGMLMALYLPIAVHFHHISAPTLFVPLIILAADRFVIWVKASSTRSLVNLVIITFLCCLARTEAVILIPIFCFFGWFGHGRWKQAVTFLILCTILYNLACWFYFVHFGYWGLSHNTGWALFTRVARSRDALFSTSNGPASKKIGEYMLNEWPQRMKDIDQRRLQMYSLNLAQKELGLIEADRLFKQASIESIRSAPWKFIKFTFLRIIGQLDLYYAPGLNFKEFPYETDSGHMWGFDEKRMQENRIKFRDWDHVIVTVIDSPLQWEKSVLKARVLRLIGFKSEIPKLPSIFRLVQVITTNKDNVVVYLNCGDGPMQERFYGYLNLEVYFSIMYWGQRYWSKDALKMLKYWDVIMPRPKARINLQRIMWVLWICGIVFNKRRWYSMSLLAMLSFVVFFATCQAVFSDNFGGRLTLPSLIYPWLGACCGILALWERALTIKHRLKDVHVRYAK
jgi:hypothetical protein